MKTQHTKIYEMINQSRNKEKLKLLESVMKEKTLLLTLQK